MTLSINAGGWNTNKNVSVNIGGTWTQAKSMWVNIGGTWYNSWYDINGSLYTWGFNGWSQLGFNDFNARSTPTLLGSSTWKTLAINCAGSHTLAIRSDGALFSWGKNSHGQLGTMTDGESATFWQINLPARIGSSTWKAMACGRNFSMGILSDDTLWGWGQNNLGQIGSGDTNNYNYPVQTGSSTWKAVASGDSHTLGILSDNTLWAWGYNGSGQLGNGVSYSTSSPVQVGSSTWKAIACGDAYSIGIRGDNTLWAWGANNYGQLGDGTTNASTSPIQIGTSTWKVIAGGGSVSGGNDTSVSAGSHTLAIRSDNTLWAWGFNAYGQLGDGTTTNRTSPTQIGSSTWKLVACGNVHSLALRSDNTIWSWGYNYDGELGDGTTTNRTSPTQIGSSTWKNIACGEYHSLAIF